MASLCAGFADIRVGRSAVLKLLNGGKLSECRLASMGEIMGTLRISRLIDLRKCKPVITHLAQPARRRFSQLLSQSSEEKKPGEISLSVSCRETNFIRTRRNWG